MAVDPAIPSDRVVIVEVSGRDMGRGRALAVLMAMVIVATFPLLVGGWMLAALVVGRNHITSHPVVFIVVLFMLSFLLYGVLTYVRWTRLPRRM